MYFDAVIVGGGLAGLNAFAQLREDSPQSSVLLIDAAGRASTEIMGFSAPVGEGDSPALFEADTLKSGAGFNDPALVHELAFRATDELARLEELGIVFDRDRKGGYDVINALGSSVPRVVHSGTTTGKQAVKLLAVPEEFLRHDRAVKLLLADGMIAGVQLQSGEVVECRACILCGGGFAGLWKFSSWSKNLRGECLSLAADAGAKLRDMAFVQFEPAVCPNGFPVITTVLNEGAKLLDKNGVSLLPPGGKPPRKRELARLIQNAVETGRAPDERGMIYDFSGVDEANFSRRYPEYYQKFRKIAPDFQHLRFRVRPGAHTTLGGIAITPDGAASVPGLFAAGEAVGGIHGADRLGGNAGLEVFVFGRIAGESAARYLQAAPHRRLTDIPPLPVTPPPEIFTRLAELLDRVYNVTHSPESVRAGMRELAGFPDCPPVRLVKTMFRDFATLH